MFVVQNTFSTNKIKTNPEVLRGRGGKGRGNISGICTLKPIKQGMRNHSWHHGITNSLGPICMWLRTKFSSAADVIWQTCLSDVDWQDFLFFPHGKHPWHNLGTSGTLQGREVFESSTIHTWGLHMHRQSDDTCCHPLNAPASTPSVHLQQQQAVQHL